MNLKVFRLSFATYIIFFSLFNTLPSTSQNLEPIVRKIGKLNISIDPRTEALSAVQLISDYPILSNNTAYAKSMFSFFEKYSNLEACQISRSLYNSNGFSYDAPVDFIFNYSTDLQFSKIHENSDYLIKRAGGIQNLDEFATKLSIFVNTSDFSKFWNSNIKFYNNILDLTVREISDSNLVEKLEEYLNEKQNSYNIVIAPVSSGGYGIRKPGSAGKFDIYSVIAPTDFRDSTPYLSYDNIMGYVWHEFGHSFVNPLTEKYIDRINSNTQLFTPIKDKMTKMAYGIWDFCVNEHIIRAINIRMYELYASESVAKQMMINERQKSFVYVEALVNKLKEFENLRNKSNVSFSEFYPELITVFDSLSKTNYSDLSKPVNFSGPINSIFNFEKIAFVLPSNDSDTSSLHNVQDYASKIYANFKQRAWILLTDTIALQNNLSDYGIIIYGTNESNLYLKSIQASFPFIDKNNFLQNENKSNSKEWRFISCMPNPANPVSGILVYTASSDKLIPGINSLDHGGEDYLFQDITNGKISKGFYKKEMEWGPK